MLLIWLLVTPILWFLTSSLCKLVLSIICERDR